MVADGGTGNGTKDGASIVVLARGSVLMVERARPPFSGLWSFPGGHVEPDEAAEETARRELLEETGLSVEHVLELGVTKPLPGVSDFRLTVFAARAGEGTPAAADDALRAEFVPFQAVLERKMTSRAVGWIARAITALAERPR